MTHIPFKVSLLRLVFLLLPVTVAAQEARLSDYVDPRIGSEGLGRVFIGPSCPYGMVKPSPDCTVHPNSGWLPMPEQVNGFSQVHVSGTGGGPKYGNILVMPFGKGIARGQLLMQEDLNQSAWAIMLPNSREQAYILK